MLFFGIEQISIAPVNTELLTGTVPVHMSILFIRYILKVPLKGHINRVARISVIELALIPPSPIIQIFLYDSGNIERAQSVQHLQKK
jgi:hypothetical protein